jgi:NADP-dependent 3-hydroxy acid dehydrogenase YdfG
LECNRYNEKSRKRNRIKQLENVLVAKLDVLDLDSIQTAFKMGVQKFGSVGVLLNNAGYGPLEAFSREKMCTTIQQCYWTLDVTKTVLPHFRQNKKFIINISSIGGK